MAAVDSLTTINTLDCIVNRKNTGFAKCAFLPGLVKKAILVPVDFYLDGSDTAFNQLMKAIVDDKANRAFPIGSFIEFTDQSTQPGSQSFNYGTSLTTNDGVPKWMFQFTNGRHCFYQKVLSFSESQDFFAVYFIDHKGQLMGVEDTIVNDDETVANILRPFTMDEIYVHNWTLGTASAVPKYTIAFTFADTEEFRNGLSYLQLEDKYTKLAGLQDVELTSADVDTAVFGITAELNCNGQNLGQYFGSEFADAALWAATNETTGNVVTISSVAWNATTGQYELTLDDADPDYTGNIVISLATPDGIYTQLGLLYESDTVTVAST